LIEEELQALKNELEIIFFFARRWGTRLIKGAKHESYQLQLFYAGIGTKNYC